MLEKFAASTVLEGEGDIRPVSYGDDSRFLVEFYTAEIEDEKETRIRGRRILKAVPHCRKRAVGDPRTVWDAPVTETDKMRWPNLWAAYNRGEEQMVIGTPLDSWPLLTREARITLRNWGYKTVEQVAETTDATLNDPQLGRIVAQVRAHAQKFLEDQEAGSNERRLADELEQRDNQIAALTNTVQQLTQAMEKLKTDRLAAPMVQPQETGPGFQPVQPVGEPTALQQGITALDALPTLEPAEPPVDPAKRKLSNADIREIRESDLPTKELAEVYKVSTTTIRNYRK